VHSLTRLPSEDKMKLKFLYEYAGHKVGQVVEVEGEEADALLDTGFVEVVEEPKHEKHEKPAKPAK